MLQCAIAILKTAFKKSCDRLIFQPDSELLAMVGMN